MFDGLNEQPKPPVNHTATFEYSFHSDTGFLDTACRGVGILACG